MSFRDKIIESSTNGRIVPVKDVNLFLFGTEKTPHTTCNDFLVMKNILLHDNNIYYLILSKLEEYMNTIGCLDTYDMKYLLINYNNILKKPLIGLQKRIFDYWLNLLEKLDDNVILNSNVIANIIGKKYFKGNIHEINENNIIINFNNNNNNIIINFSIDSINNINNININNIITVDLNCDINENHLVKIINSINNFLLLCDPDKYVKNNLTIITGNELFASMLVDSHMNKKEFIIPVDIINTIISFKSKKSMKEYIQKFCEIYQTTDIFIKQKETNFLFLNFEGMNKYFLNLETEYLIDFEMKELVNNLYYSITNELISCYKNLYNFLKRN